MYLSKQSDDQRPRTLMSHGGKFAEAAVVAAPIRKLCPANPLDSRPSLLIRSLVSLVSFSRVKSPPDTQVKWGPESEDKGLEFRYACCGIFHCVWNISAPAGSINNQDCISHFLRFIAFVHSYITIVLNVLLKITMLTSFIATTSKRLDYVCPAANRTWQRLTIISCDLTHERDTYFLNISHIIYLNYYLPRINRLQSKPLRLMRTNRVNSIIRHRMWLYA